MADVVVIGGGVIGLSIAYELAGQGVAVRILDKGQFGREASWAGAGILPPGNPDFAVTPAARLRSASHVLWPDLSEQLRETTGIDNGFRRCGGLEVRLKGPVDELRDDVALWREEGVLVESATAVELIAAEPNLHPQITAAYRLPELAQVRNPRHLKAMIAGCIGRGVQMSPGQPVVGFDVREGRVNAVRTPEGRISADEFCLCGGAWSAGLAGQIQQRIDVKPIRGQIVMLSAEPGCLRHVIQVGARYLVPRPDGRVLVGSTEENVGFDKRTTADAVAGLIQFAVELVPVLADAEVERTWAGLRPGSPSGLPYLSRMLEIENLSIAAGHFRSGLQTSPATAIFMRQLILGEPTEIPAEPFACNRPPET